MTDASHQKTKEKKPKFVQEDSPEPPSSGYQPPNGFEPLSYDKEADYFDWDAVNRDPNLEIWAIRIPLQLKPKYLDRMSFPLSQGGSADGSIARISAGKKQTQYNIKVASSSAGAEEMKGMSCLLPRRAKGGKLFIAQKPLAGHLVFSESPVASASEPQGESPLSSGTLPLPNSRRSSHPAHLLRHKYIPTSVRRPGAASAVSRGSDTTIEEDSKRGEAATMELDEAPMSRPGSPTKPHKKRKKGIDEPEGEKEKKGKKKRTHVES